MAVTIEGEDKVLAMAQRIVQSLGNTSDADDMLLILSAFDNRFSSLTSVSTDDQHTSTSAGDSRLEVADRIILNDAYSSFFEDYLAAVDEIIQLTEEFNLNSNFAPANGSDDIIDRAENALQLAMTQLEDEFRHILV